MDNRDDLQDQQVIPVLGEELHVGKKAVRTGGVRVHRRVEEHTELVDIPLKKEHVDVRRVVVDREVDGPLPIRQEGDVTIVPVVEEVLVVQKRYVLKEELHIRKTVTEERHREQVPVRRQEAEVQELDSAGRARLVESRRAEQREPPSAVDPRPIQSTRVEQSPVESPRVERSRVAPARRRRRSILD